MTLYPEMNNKIVELLRMGNTPVELYAAQRIEELELKNKELIDRMLKIIEEKNKRIYTEHRNHDAWERGYTDALDELEEAVLDLKGERE